MYQVMLMYGDFEPWWFLDDWEDDVTKVTHFDTFDEAKEYFYQLWNQLKDSYPCFKSRKDYLVAFWTQDESRWCEECDEDLQQYHSLLLLKDGKVLPQDLFDSSLEMSSGTNKPQSCCVLNLS